MGLVHWIYIILGAFALVGAGVFIKTVLLRPKRSYESILGDDLKRFGVTLKEWKEAPTGETGPFGKFNVVPVGMSTRTVYLIVTVQSETGASHEAWARLSFLFYDKFLHEVRWHPDLSALRDK